MRVVLDTNQVEPFINSFQNGNFGAEYNRITLSPLVLAEILLYRKKRKYILKKLRNFNIKLGLPPFPLALQNTSEIASFRPFINSKNSQYDWIIDAFINPKESHFKWAHGIKNLHLDYCKSLEQDAVKFRQALRSVNLHKTKFENMNQALKVIGETHDSFIGEMILVFVTSGCKKEEIVSSPKDLFAAIKKNQYLERLYKMFLWLILSVSRAWKDQQYNFDPKSNRDDITDVTLPLYAADGDLILTGDGKLKNGITMISPKRSIIVKNTDEL